MGSLADQRLSQPVSPDHGVDLVRNLLDFCLVPGGERRDKAVAVRELNRCDVPAWDAWDEPPQLVLRRILDAVEKPEFVADWRGYKFLGKVMAAYPDKIEFLQNIHRGVLVALNNIPTTARTCYYGRMYEAAWDRSADVGRTELRARVEELVQRMVSMRRDDDDYALGELNTRVFIIVEVFLQKTVSCPVMAQMMAEVMEDFIWPQLESPCSVRRCNAADMFFLAHPMEKPELGVQQADFLLRQHEVMLALLEDDRHTVRYVAVRGVCVALSKYWHIFEERVRRNLLKSLFSERPYDGDWRVRQQVYRCSRKLLDRDEAAAALQQLLPELRNCFHDVNSAVRLEFVELLHAIKQADVFPFFYAVSLDHLVARLREEAVETNVHSLVRLLLPYFCPLEEAPDVLFKRIFSLYRMNVEALWKLFFHAEVIMLRTEAVQLMSCILTGVHDSVRGSRRSGSSASRSSSRGRQSSRGKAGRAGSRGSRGSRGGSRSRRPAPAELMNPSDPDGAAALLQVVGILWRTRVERSPGKETGVDEAAVEQQVAELRATLQRVTPLLLEALENTEAHSSLQALSGACQSAAGTGALRDAMQAVRSATEDTATNAIETYIDTLMNQNGVTELVGLLSRALTSTWTRVPGSGGVVPPAAAALIMVEVMLNTTSICAPLVERHYEDLASLTDVLKKFQTLLSTRLALRSPLTGRRNSVALTDDLLERGVDLHLRLVACLGAAPHVQATAQAIAQGVEALNWAERFLVPLLPEAAEMVAAKDVMGDTNADGHDKPLVVRVVRSVLLHADAMVSSRLYDGPFLASCVEFCYLVMSPAAACHNYFLVLVVDLVVNALDVFRNKDSVDEVDGRGIMENHIFPVVCGLLDLLPEVCAGRAEAARKKEAVVVTASAAYQALLTCELHFSDSSELRSGLIAAIAWNVMEIVHMEVNMGGGDAPRDRAETIADLPLSCGSLISPLERTMPRMKALLQSLQDWHSRDFSDDDDTSKSAALELVLCGLASGPVEGRMKKLIQDAIKEIAGEKPVEVQPEQLGVQNSTTTRKDIAGEEQEQFDINSNSLEWSLFSNRNSSNF